MQGQHWVCEPSVKCVVCTIKHTCGKQIFIYLMSINALIYIGELNQKNLHNKLKSETGWTRWLHCPSLTHFVVVSLLPRNMPFLLVSFTLASTFLSQTWREALLPAGVLKASQLPGISEEEGLPLGRGSGQKGEVAITYPFLLHRMATSPQRELGKSCSQGLFLSKSDPLILSQ